MANVNRVTLIGRLTRDPELRYTPSNMPVSEVGLAINRKWMPKNGDEQEETTFVDCSVFGKSAELICQYVKKGESIYIEGRLKMDEWNDREGQKRSKLKVVVDNFQFLPRGEQKPIQDIYSKPVPKKAPPPEIPESEIPF